MTLERTTFSDLQAVVEVMASYQRPWFVSGGWAIDLFLGAVSREHEDIEIGVFRSHQKDARWLLEPDWTLEKAATTPEGPAWVPWYEGEYLVLPIHQVRVSNAARTPLEFQLFLNDEDGSEWYFRRHAEIRRPKTSLALRSDAGIWYLRPEIQLLYKARLMRDKDALDFRAAAPRLDARAITWLCHALHTYLPDHPWLEQLEESTDGPGC
jgi:hypothetical protein